MQHSSELLLPWKAASVSPASPQAPLDKKLQGFVARNEREGKGETPGRDGPEQVLHAQVAILRCLGQEVRDINRSK